MAGKTTCLTLRILKLLLVDQIPPDGILATTFTKKAAEELRSRILGWGFRILDVLDQDPLLSPEQKASVAAIDINTVPTTIVMATTLAPRIICCNLSGIDAFRTKLIGKAF